jgi:hypothetical protein
MVNLIKILWQRKLKNNNRMKINHKKVMLYNRNNKLINKN